MPYAEIAVVGKTQFHHAFTYRVPDGMVVASGDAVQAPFGREIVTGIILTVAAQSEYAGETRDLLLGGEPVLLPHQVQLAGWLQQRYHAPIAACVGLMLPPEAERRLAEAVEWVGDDLPAGLTPADQRLAERLRAGRRVSPAALRRSFGGGADAAVLRLVEQGAVRRRVSLAAPPAVASPAPPSPVSPPVLSPAQQQAIGAITAALDQARPAVFLLHGVTGSGKTEVYLAAMDAARRLGKRSIILVPEIVLTPQTVQRFEARAPGLVAVSHSGLTPAQRYRQWHDVRAGGRLAVVGARGALFLPQAELGLIVLDEEHEWSYKQQDPAPRYHARDVAIQLAALTNATVVLGSATPDVASYYHAEQGRYTLLNLGDRVPRPVSSVDSVYRQGTAWQPERRVAGGSPPGRTFGDTVPEDAASSARPPTIPVLVAAGAVVDADESLPVLTPPAMPPVTVVDLAAELRAGNRGIFSRLLDSALTATLRDGEQAILFLNRRGTASFVLCRDCGHVPHCGSCLVPLTLHAAAERLRCHHCNRQRRAPPRCSECQSARIRPFGLGTQKVEEEVKARFPAARVLRWDRDAARTSADHEALLAAFAGRQADVLVGTQMIAKGLDLPGVTLVGVISADIALNLPDYRAGERAYQLLTQVAGRAGRGERPGRVIVQTYSPGHYAVRAAAAYDYQAMYQAEIALRRQAGYPPFGRLARLLYEHTNPRRAEEEARRLARELRDERDRRGIPSTELIGPAPAFMERLKGRWRWQLIVRAPDPVELLRAVEFPRGWRIDIDPASLM